MTKQVKQQLILGITKPTKNVVQLLRVDRFFLNPKNPA